jgi:hypothetical protein
MSDKLIVVETKDGNIVTKARYMEQSEYDKHLKHFRHGQTPIRIIDESDLDKYPVDIFSELKPNPLKTNKSKSNEKSDLS